MKNEKIKKQATWDYQNGIKKPFGNKRMRKLYIETQSDIWLENFEDEWLYDEDGEIDMCEFKKLLKKGKEKWK